MTTATILDQFTRDIASVIPQIDTTAKHRRWQSGIGAFEEEVQVEWILENLGQQPTPYADTRTKVQYPNRDQLCDIILNRDGVQIPIEVELLRFYRDNGES